MLQCFVCSLIPKVSEKKGATGQSFIRKEITNYRIGTLKVHRCFELICQFSHHFWVGATANPPNSDDRHAQLTRCAFIIDDFLQNPHFSNFKKSGRYFQTFVAFSQYLNFNIKILSKSTIRLFSSFLMNPL